MQVFKHKYKLVGLVAGLAVLVVAAVLASESNTGSVASGQAADDSALSDEALEILAIGADPEYGEYLASECSSCHNPKATEDSPVPNIYGKSRESIIENLLAYKNGGRDNTTMKGVAGKFSDEEIAALAIYLAAYQI